MYSQKLLHLYCLLLGRHISESVFVSFYENVEVFNAKGLRNVLTLVHCICCMPLLLGLILHTCPSVEYISSLFGIGPSTTVIE